MATCLATDGQSSVVINNTIQLRTSDFTIEAWVKPSSGGSIFSNKVNGGGESERGGFIFSISADGRIHLILDNGFAFQSYDSHKTADLFDGNWHHVAAVRENFALSTYVDGTRTPGEAHGNGDPASMDLQTTWRGAICGGPDGADLATQITELRLWWGSRSQDVIRQHLMSRLSGTETNLMVAWALADGTANEPRGQFNGAPQGNCRFVPSDCPIDLPH